MLSLEMPSQLVVVDAGFDCRPVALELFRSKVLWESQWKDWHFLVDFGTFLSGRGAMDRMVVWG